MKSSCFPSATLTSTATSPPRNGLIERPFGYSQFLKFPSSKKHPLARNLKLVGFRAQASGSMKVSSEAVGETPKKADSKDNNLAFVAGATGKVGSRTVRELLKLGYRVRAGVRSAQRAQDLVQSVKRMKLDPEITEEGTQPVEKLEIVECDLEKPSQIGPALGNASVVLCCIGAGEKEVFDITGPYRIDYQATKNLVDAATAAKVNHFIMVSSLGTNKVGFPAAILNLFWGVLIWKRKAEEALIASGLPYTIVRPGGMERPTDAYKETHNITLSQEDTLFGGQVSNLQVAELIACMARNRSLSYCKVVEVIAETTAPLTPMEELLAKIPSQRAEPKDSGAADGFGPASLRSTIPEKPSVPVEKEPDGAKSEAIQSLSPYSTYEDLKPPTSPTQTPSTTSCASKTSDLDATPTAPMASILSDSSSTTLERDATQEVMKKTRALSPYFVYDDLKGPTSTSPTPLVGKKDLTIVDGLSTAGVSDTQVDIPETVSAPTVPSKDYDDLKPPTSPAPTPPAGQKDLTTVDGLSTTGVSDIQTTTTEITVNVTETVPAPKVTIDVAEKVPAPEMPHKRPLSPYYAYEDLKPPSSPSPTPSGPQEIPLSNSTPEAPSLLSGGNDVAKTTVASVIEENLSQNSTYHLSPYHMYEDMKPPSSPSPSPRKS